MKQRTINYSNVPQLEKELKIIAHQAKSNNISKIWIQSYVTQVSGECIEPIAASIKKILPDAEYMITHAGMTFASGEAARTEAIIVCNLFEDPSTKFEMLQFDFNDDNYEEVEDKIIEYVNANPWIKLISLNIGQSLFCIGKLKKLAASIDPDIAISGGAAITSVLDQPAKVLTSAGHISTDTIALAFIGGENFHARTDVTVGWKGIGKEFTITKSDGPILLELDGAPAFEVYEKYFKIKAKPGVIVDETIAFPLCFEDAGLLFLRCPFILQEDGSMIMMMNDFDIGKTVRLSFGSPEVILDELSTNLNEIASSEPQVISVNSCIGRFFFWGDDIKHELSMFQKVAESSGYLTGGEIIRKGDRLLILNETIVTTAMREGSKSIDGLNAHRITRNINQYSLTHRLASFIDTVTHDLEEYSKIIERLAITDELTSMNNRREIEHRIRQAAESGKPYSLIMLDLDNFKQINDRFGHKEGDNTLKFFSGVIQIATSQCEHEVHAGRWGGDEFLLVLVGSDENDTTVSQAAMALAETIQNKYNSDTAFENYNRTVSIGIADSADGIDVDTLFLDVDAKLYEAKANGKSCIMK